MQTGESSPISGAQRAFCSPDRRADRSPAGRRRGWGWTRATSTAMAVFDRLEANPRRTRATSTRSRSCATGLRVRPARCRAFRGSLMFARAAPSSSPSPGPRHGAGWLGRRSPRCCIAPLSVRLSLFHAFEQYGRAARAVGDPSTHRGTDRRACPRHQDRVRDLRSARLRTRMPWRSCSRTSATGSSRRPRGGVCTTSAIGLSPRRCSRPSTAMRWRSSRRSRRTAPGC